MYILIILYINFIQANVSYRYYPEIILKVPIYDDDAKLLQNYFSPGVIDLVKNKNGRMEAKVVNTRIDSNSRNVKHDEKLKDLVILGRRPNHFICILIFVLIFI